MRAKHFLQPLTLFWGLFGAVRRFLQQVPEFRCKVRFFNSLRR